MWQGSDKDDVSRDLTSISLRLNRNLRVKLKPTTAPYFLTTSGGVSNPPTSVRIR